MSQFCDKKIGSSHAERFDRESAYLVYRLWIAIVYAVKWIFHLNALFWLSEATIFQTVNWPNSCLCCLFLFMTTDALIVRSNIHWIEPVIYILTILRLKYLLNYDDKG